MADRSREIPERAAIEAYAIRYDLCLPERQAASLIGELAGKRTGSSVEYQDRKDYVLGDDVRHIDWRAYARNDRLTVKLYREEICPTVDIVIDTSRSMSIADDKSVRRHQLGYLFYLLAQKINAVTRLYDLGRNLAPVRTPFDLLAGEDRRQDSPLPALENAPLARRAGIKILVSDFLFPFAPEDLVRLFRASDRLVLVQVLSRFEDDPGVEGEVRLEDAETEQFLDLALNRATVEGYRSRLNRLRNDLERRLLLVGGTMAIVRDSDSLEETMRRLSVARIVEI
ncbi:DUF58 domain-containing protein [Candidatus Sumerlaeota bacterium]|nr:DUF58 domain-containing protein [Candidatus Sumerlaeota bacterium]